MKITPRLDRHTSPWDRYAALYGGKSNPYSDFSAWEHWMREQMRDGLGMTNEDDLEEWLTDNRPCSGDVWLFCIMHRIHAHHVQRSPTAWISNHVRRFLWDVHGNARVFVLKVRNAVRKAIRT